MTENERQRNFKLVKKTLKPERDRIHLIKGVVGTGITHSDITGIGKGYHLIIYLQYEDPSIIKQLPRTINGIPVAYQITGEIKPLPVYCTNSCTSNCGFIYHYRPLQAGASIGNINMLSLGYCDAGTIGGFPKTPDGQRVLLSCNHVLAHDTPGESIAQIGQSIIQPGTIDGGDTINDVSGTLAKWIKIVPKGSGLNGFDCAYEIINPDISINLTNLCNYNISGYTIPFPGIGMNIQKAGRTSRCTTGTIVALDVTMDVNYSLTSTPALATFTNQIQTSSNFAQSGDSGSVVVESYTWNAVGLLFAGASDGTAWCNVMADLEHALGVSFQCPTLSNSFFTN